MSEGHIPDWMDTVLSSFFTTLGDTLSVVTVSRSGIQGVVDLPGQRRTLQEATRKMEFALGREPKEVELFETEEEQAETAKREVESGFRILHSNAVMLCWAYLEALVDDLLVGSIANNDALLTSGDLASLKVPVGEFLSLKEHERSHYLAGLASRSTRQKARGGDRLLEDLLALIGLDGDLPNGLKTNLNVFYKVRNVIAHRGGVVDYRFASECAMLNPTIGSVFPVSEKAFLACGMTAIRYGVEVFSRART